jgi:hypothetical protein
VDSTTSHTMHVGEAHLPTHTLTCTVCCAVGNPHQLGAKPLTFTRQVIAHALPGSLLVQC